MSRCARRVAAMLRWRAQAARLIAIATDPECESLHCSACGGLGEGDTDEDGHGWCIPCDGWYEYSDEDGCCLRCGADLLPAPPCDICGGSGRGLDVLARAILAGQQFDVALARAHGERLVAEGEKLAAERACFVDWTQTQGRNYATSSSPARRRAVGMGPLNTDLGAFVLDRWAYAYTSGVRDRLVADGWEVGEWVWVGGVRIWAMVERFRGGWPGSLAREYGWKTCTFCDGGASPVWDSTGRVVRCRACKGRGRTRKPGVPAGFANGDSIARTAQRLLDTLDGRCPWAPGAVGQASECPDCAEGTKRVTESCREQGIDPALMLALLRESCCQGTGHNLAGVLPPIDWMSKHALRRKLADMPVPPREAETDDWITRLLDEGRAALLAARDAPLRTVLDDSSSQRTVERAETRVVPRGVHELLESHDIESAQSRLAALDVDAHRRTWRLLRSPEWTPFTTLEEVAEPYIRALTGLVRGSPEVGEIRTALQAEGDRIRRSRTPAWRRGELRHAEQRARRRESTVEIRVVGRVVGHAEETLEETLRLVEQMPDQPAAVMVENEEQALELFGEGSSLADLIAAKCRSNEREIDDADALGAD